MANAARSSSYNRSGATSLSARCRRGSGIGGGDLDGDTHSVFSTRSLAPHPPVPALAHAPIITVASLMKRMILQGSESNLVLLPEVVLLPEAALRMSHRSSRSASRSTGRGHGERKNQGEGPPPPRNHPPRRDSSHHGTQDGTNDEERSMVSRSVSSLRTRPTTNTQPSQPPLQPPPPMQLGVRFHPETKEGRVQFGERGAGGGKCSMDVSRLLWPW